MRRSRNRIAGEGAGAGDSKLKELRELASIAFQLLAVGTMLDLDQPNHFENETIFVFRAVEW